MLQRTPDTDATLYADFTALLDRADRMGISLSSLSRSADCSLAWLMRMRIRERPISRQTLNRLRLALSRIRTNDTSTIESNASALYRISVAHVCSMTGLSPHDLLGSDPARRATADPAWLQLARHRRYALYVANVIFNVPQAELARVANMSRAAVSIAMNHVEDERATDAAIDQMFVTLEAVVEL